jgi:hypothetical protein
MKHVWTPLPLSPPRVETEMNKMSLRTFIAVTEEKFAARDHALSLALASLDKRLDGMNEFRAALTDQATRTVTREEYVLAHADIARSVDQLHLDLSNRVTIPEFSVRHDQLLADIRRLENTATGATNKRDFEKLEDRVKFTEGKLATWDGRLWALGTLFLLINVVVSWYFRSH